MNTKDRTYHVKKLALESGFDLCGITSPKLPDMYAKRFLLWVQKKYYADMDWISKNVKKCMSPHNRFPWAKSVIVLAVNYFQNDPKKKPDESYGVIARYARGRDYHRVFEKQMKCYVKTLQDSLKFDNSQFRCYVDYGPVLERAYAEQAGIGFIGKSGNIITPEFGSWVLLCEIFTNIELHFDTAIERRCGRCQRCKKACPAKAIVDDGFVDARLCVSYHTIENKKNIPELLHKFVGNKIFGCDICQEICPHNTRRRQKPTSHQDFIQIKAGAYLSLDDIDYMNTDAEYKKRFQGSPLMRAKFSGLKRNSCIVRKNQI